MTPRFRRAEAEDAPLIHQLLEEMAQEDGGKIMGSVQSLLAHGFGPQPMFHTVLAEAEAPLGLLIYFPEYSTWRGKIGLYVQDVFVRPQARGLGLGRAILAAALRDARFEVGFVTLMVSRKNPKARGFYEALGFTQRDITDPMILSEPGLAALRSA